MTDDTGGIRFPYIAISDTAMRIPASRLGPLAIADGRRARHEGFAVR